MDEAQFLTRIGCLGARTRLVCSRRGIQVLCSPKLIYARLHDTEALFRTLLPSLSDTVSDPKDNISGDPNSSVSTNSTSSRSIFRNISGRLAPRSALGPHSPGAETMAVRIHFDRPHSHFTNLDFLTGKVVFNLAGDAAISAITVKLEGESRTRLSGPRPHYDSNRPDKSRTELEWHKVSESCLDSRARWHY